jgi:putative tryptophan/tyrosine transport system substrate-binding protein
MIQRRTLLSVLCTLAFPGAPRAFAQHGRVWHVGFLALPARPEPIESSRFGGFSLGMRELGYTEGKDLTVDWRFADEDLNRLTDSADDLVKRKVDVLVAGSTPAVRAAQRATTIIPIVFANVNDPVGDGFVESLGRPGHNITGTSSLSRDLGPKLVEMLVTVAPQVERVGILGNPINSSNAKIINSLQFAFQEKRLVSLVLEAARVIEIDKAFSTMTQQGIDAVVVAADTLFVEQRQQIAELAAKYHLPSIFSFREHVEAGGLLSYGQSLTDGYRRAATYVDKILKGASPSVLPIEQSTKLELVINVKTARIMNLTIPQALLARADEVIE